MIDLTEAVSPASGGTDSRGILSPAEKTAVAMGLFDGLHLGHQDVIHRAVDFIPQGIAPAVFTFETDTVTSKGDGGVDVILSKELKYELMDKLGVKYIYSPHFKEIRGLSGEDFVRLILRDRLNAGVVICGEDFSFGQGGKNGYAQLKQWCGQWGIDVIVIPPTLVDGRVVSSTRIRESIKAGDLPRANRLLGYDFSLKLPVVHGNALGRTMNFPTINQLLPQRQIIPKFGVYYSKTELAGKLYRSITNIGVKPTVGGEKVPLAETYIFDYSGDLYGRTVKISLNTFIRAEKKFSGTEELFAQIAEDIETAKEFIRKGK